AHRQGTMDQGTMENATVRDDHRTECSHAVTVAAPTAAAAMVSAARTSRIALPGFHRETTASAPGVRRSGGPGATHARVVRTPYGHGPRRPLDFHRGTPVTMPSVTLPSGSVWALPSGMARAPIATWRIAPSPRRIREERG